MKPRTVLIPLLVATSCLLTVAAQAQNFFGPRVTIGTASGFVAAYQGGGGQLAGNSPNQWAWEEFELFDINGGAIVHGDVIAVRTQGTRQFISNNGGSTPAEANRQHPNPWEQFQVTRIGGPGVLRHGDRFALRGFHGQFLGINLNFSDAKVGCWYPWIGGWETLVYIDRHDRSDTRGNCVRYARARVPLPEIDLTYWRAKKSIINRYVPTPGSVAVMNIGDPRIGHLAVVEQVHGDGTITVREANNPTAGIRARRGTPGSMRIEGYYRP